MSPLPGWKVLLRAMRGVAPEDHANRLPRLRWWKEVVIVGLLYALYETSRNALEGSTKTAFRNALRVIDWQRQLGINIELDLQRQILDTKWLVHVANYFYGSLWLVATGAALIWLYHARPDAYPRWRTTLMVATGIALVGFYVFPLMPPRLLDSLGDGRSFGFVDTLKEWPPIWAVTADRAQGMSNRFAAMPSMHCGWALWVSAAVAQRLRNRWLAVLVWAFTPATVWVVAVTGNHYLLDAVGGYLAIGAGYVVAVLISPSPLPTRERAAS